MPKTLYRFEASFDGEPQGCGMFTTLYDIGMPNPKPKLIENMFQHLKSPNLDEPASFWFTEYGLLKFIDAIIYMMTAIEPYGWNLTMATTRYDTNSPDVLYKDDMQIAIAYECRPDDPEDYHDITPSELLKLAAIISNNPTTKGGSEHAH